MIMSEEPDYSKYTENQLFDAYSHIDKSRFPDRTYQLEQEIEKRKVIKAQELKETSKDSSKDLSKKSKTLSILKSGFFKTSLISVLSILSIINIFAILLGSLVSLIPLTFQITILVLIFIDHPLQIFLTKLWAIIILISGIAGVVSTISSFISIRVFGSTDLSMHPLYLSWIFLMIFSTALGLYFYKGTKYYVVELKDIKTNNLT